jgi:peptidoglycan-N-acetylglucosamine deacetylase
MIAAAVAPAHADEAAATGRSAAAAAATTDSVLGHSAPISGDEAPGMVAFTFDDGPKPGTTDAVIDALVAYDVPATFFVVGRRLVGKKAQASRDLVTRMVELGFDVGNHSYDHPNLRTIAAKKVASQVDRTNEVVARLIGKPVGLFRAPYGAHSKASHAHVAKRGMTVVDWSIDSTDWKRPKAAKMRKAIVDAIFRDNGGVVLMHDTKTLTATTIAGILDDVEARNCARLAAGEPIVVPTSLHYFLRDGKTARAVPDEVEARTQRYRDGLPARCEGRGGEQMATTQ